MVELNLDFGKKKEQQSAQAQRADTSSELRDLVGRVRMLEDSVSNLRKKVQITDSNLISRSKHLDSEIKATYADIKEFKNELADLRDKMALMFKELKLRATSDDFKVLKRYIELWEPINFVTKNDVEDIVAEKVSEALRSNAGVSGNRKV